MLALDPNQMPTTAPAGRVGTMGAAAGWVPRFTAKGRLKRKEKKMIRQGASTNRNIKLKGNDSTN